MIFKTCDRQTSRRQIPAKAQASSLKPCPRVKKLDDLCPLELTLISQIIPFMYIVAKQKVAQHDLKGQCVLVPANLKKIQGITSTMPRTCNNETVISLVLKRRLSDISYVNKQNIRPILANKALEKLIGINPFYCSVCIDDSWATLSQETDPLLSALANENSCLDENVETDSDEEIEGNNAAHEKELHESSVPFPTVLQNIDGPELSVDDVNMHQQKYRYQCHVHLNLTGKL